MQSATYRRKIVFTVFKVVLIGLISWVLYNQIWNRDNLSNILTEISLGVEDRGYYLLIATIMLMPVNWVLESYKWKSIVSQFQKFSLGQAIRSVLSGVTMAIWTPARIGEYGGRLIGIGVDNRGQALIGNFISSLSQNIVNLSIGLFATILFLNTTDVIGEDSKLLIFISGGVVLSLLTFAYYNLAKLGKVLELLPNWRWITIAKDKIKLVDNLEISFLLRLLTLSTFRYAIYLTQYVLLILFFSVTQDIYVATIGVATVFFIQSNLPLPPVLSVLARGELAILLWSVFTDNTVGILASTFTLWIINLGIPAIIGLIHISRYQVEPKS